MKIGFILYDYYPFGGLQEDCLATALATQARGHEVHIYTRTWTGEQPKEIEAHLLGKKGWSNLSRNDYFFQALAEQLPKQHLDGVVAFSRIPNADIYFAADPCYLERTKQMPWWRKLSRRHRYYAKLEATVFQAADSPETLVLTEREISAFRKHYGVPTERFHLLPPGVNRNTSTQAEKIKNRAELRRELGTSTTTTVALFVGSGFRIKGLDRALRSLKTNQTSTSELEFWVVGNDKPARYKHLLNNMSVTVRFLGGRADVARFYDTADFLLHPAYSESAGKVLLEALTHGLPVLTTDTCGYAPHIEQANAGHVVPSPFTQNNLNQAVKKFIRDADARKQWSQNALQYSDTHDLYSCHQAAAELIEKQLLRD